jgi:hypothetical protein
MTTRDDDDDDDDGDDKLMYVLCVMGTFIDPLFLSFCQVLSVSLLSHMGVQWRSYSSIIMATI